jgi:hypothetical protein
MSRLRSTLINGDLTTTNTITIPQRNVSWIDGFKNSPIKIIDSTDSSNYTPWLIQYNIADTYTSYVSFGTFINDITLVGIHKTKYDDAIEIEPESNNSNIAVASDPDVTFEEDLDENCMVRWWFNVDNGGFGIRGSKKRLNDKNCYYINSNNYTNYMPSKAGSGASGTWGINISGNAASLSKVLSIDKGGTGHSSMQSGCILVKGSGIGTFPCLKANNSTYGIETTTAQAKIGVWNNYNTVELATNQNAGIYCDAKTFTDGETNPPDSIYGKESRWLIYINTSGTVTKNTSDKRRKLYIEDMPENETKVLLNVPIRNFVFKEDIGHNDLEQNGVFAQDLRELLKKNNIGNRPYLQWEYNDNDRDDVYYDINAPEKDDMTYSVSYNHMIPALIKGWQMQNKEIEELEKKLAILRIKKLGK